MNNSHHVSLFRNGSLGAYFGETIYMWMYLNFNTQLVIEVEESNFGMMYVFGLEIDLPKIRT